MAQKDFSAKKLENVMNQGKEWISGFKESVWFKQLTSSAQDNAEMIILSFSEFMYKEELRAARQWTAASLQNILENILPKELPEYKAISGDIQSVLTGYFDFLGEEKKITNANTLKKKVNSMEFSSNSSTEETNKNSKLVGKSEKKNKKITNQKFSQEEINRFNRFSMGSMQEDVAPLMPTANFEMTKVGRNDLCPCGSGKKYKKCHGK